MDPFERRTFVLREMRVAKVENGPTKIEGYAAVFDQLSEPMWGFREKIQKGAFEESIQIDDIRALFNHDPNYVLGRNMADTLTLEEDEHGLKISITPPDTQWARDLMESIQRGDIDQMSFGFQTITDSWTTENEETVRTLVKVRLFDVSPVTFPAYPQTSVSARDIMKLRTEQVNQADPGSDNPEEASAPSRLDLLRKRLDLAEIE